jgi:uncharacterized protein
MRVLLVGLALWLLGLWIWRAARGAVQRPPQDDPRPPKTVTQDAVACAHCGLHIPAAEALAGSRGRYCCDEHRRLAER